MQNRDDILLDTIDVDQAWITDWAAEGLAALERYLAKQAAFESYLRNRDLHSDHGDGRTRD
jgi:hypothetical protein